MRCTHASQRPWTRFFTRLSARWEPKCSGRGRGHRDARRQARNGLLQSRSWESRGSRGALGRSRNGLRSSEFAPPVPSAAVSGLSGPSSVLKVSSRLLCSAVLCRGFPFRLLCARGALGCSRNGPRSSEFVPCPPWAAVSGHSGPSSTLKASVGLLCSAALCPCPPALSVLRQERTREDPKQPPTSRMSAPRAVDGHFEAQMLGRAVPGPMPGRRLAAKFFIFLLLMRPSGLLWSPLASLEMFCRVQGDRNVFF